MTKKLIALFLALTMIFAFAACDKDDKTPSGDGGNTPCTSHTDADGNKLCDSCGADLTPPCTNHTDTNLDNKCDTCGAAVEATVENTAVVLASAVKAQLDAAKSFKLTLTFDQVITQKYWDDVDGTPTEFTETMTTATKMTYTVSKTETGFNARVDIENTMANGGEDDEPVVETSHAYIIDGISYAYDEDVEKYIKQDLEIAEADSLAKLAEGITLTDEEIAELTKSVSEGFVTAFDYENRKGSVTVDIKPYFDSYYTVINGMKENTATVADIYNALLATNGGTATVEALLEKAEELLGMTPLEAYDAIDAWLTENHKTTLQALFVSIVTDPRYPTLVENALKAQGITDETAIGEALAEISALKDKVLRDELAAELTEMEMTEVTLYELLLLMTADPEATEEPIALNELMAGLELMFEQTVAEARESENPLLSILESIMPEKVDAFNAKIEVSFNDAFGISAITFNATIDNTSVSESLLGAEHTDSYQTVSKISASFTDLSAVAIPIEGPAEEDILEDEIIF